MRVSNFFLFLMIAGIASAAIRLKNTGSKSLVFYTLAEGIDEPDAQLVAPGNYSDIVTIVDWVGSFYTYPEECLKTNCSYPATRVMLALQQPMLNGFYDFYAVDLNQGFNFPASVSPLFNSKCSGLKCKVDLLEICPQKDQIFNGDGDVVSCRTSTENYQKFQELCPEAIVDAPDPNLGVCTNDNWQITFG